MGTLYSNKNVQKMLASATEIASLQKQMYECSDRHLRFLDRAKTNETISSMYYQQIARCLDVSIEHAQEIVGIGLNVKAESAAKEFAELATKLQSLLK